MEVKFSVNNGFTEVVLSGAINMSNLMTLTPQITHHLHEHVNNHLVVNLSNTTFIDSSTIRLFLNIQKRLHESKKTLYLLTPSDTVNDILITTNLSKAIPIIDSLTEIKTECDCHKLLQCTYPENNTHRLYCSCEICGSQNVIGYFLNTASFDWSWKNDDIFPYSTDKSKNYFDFFSALPIFCTECYMCSIDIAQFNILDIHKNTVCHSTIDAKTKVLLSRSINKRKKMVEPLTNMNSFLYPRDRYSSFQAYQLANDCLRTAAINKTAFNPFLIGYVTFLSIKYSEDCQKEDLFNSCYKWLSQALNEKAYTDHVQLSQIYYMVLVSLLHTGQHKEAIDVFANFLDMIQKLKEDVLNSVESPFFWFKKAEMICKREMGKKSLALAN